MTRAAILTTLLVAAVVFAALPVGQTASAKPGAKTQAGRHAIARSNGAIRRARRANPAGRTVKRLRARQNVPTTKKPPPTNNHFYSHAYTMN